MPTAPVYEHTGREAPHPRAGKLEQVRAAMRDAGATHHLISTVDDIAWLLNLRGADVGYNGDPDRVGDRTLGDPLSTTWAQSPRSPARTVTTA